MVGGVRALGHIVNHLLARYTEHDQARAARQGSSGNTLQRLGRDVVVAREVARKIVGITEIMVVLIETVGETSEAAEPFETANDLGVDGITGTLDFGARGSVGCELADLSVDGALELLERDTGPRGRLDGEDRSELHGFLARAHVLC